MIDQQTIMHVSNAKERIQSGSDWRKPSKAEMHQGSANDASGDVPIRNSLMLYKATTRTFIRTSGREWTARLVKATWMCDCA